MIFNIVQINKRIFRVNTTSSSKPDGDPILLEATTISEAQIDLAWTNGSTDEDGIRVERSTDGITYNTIGSVGAGISIYSDLTCSPITLYYYRVRAFKGAKYSAYSNVDSATTLPFSAGKFAGWWFIEDEASNEVPDIVSGNSATIQGGAFKGNALAKANDYFMYNVMFPGYEDFSFWFQVILDTIDATYAVIISYDAVVNKGRIQFNNQYFYLYDDAGNELHWDISALVTNGHHTFELRGVTGVVTLYIDDIAVSGQDASALTVLNLCDVLKNSANAGLPAWCTIFDIKYSVRESRSFLINLGDRTGEYADMTKSNILDTTILTQWKPDAVIGNGDYGVYDVPVPATLYEDLMIHYHDAGFIGSKFWTTIGNHDIANLGVDADEFLSYFGYAKTYYTVIIGEAQFFFYDVFLKEDESAWYSLAEQVLRTVASYQNSTQGIWLANQLAASTARWKVLVLHVPPWASTDPLADNYCPGMRWDWYSHGVDLIIAGHRHNYERLLINTGTGSVPEIVSGIGGHVGNGNFTDPVRPDSIYHTNRNTDLEINDGLYCTMFYNKNFFYYRVDGSFSAAYYKIKDSLLLTKLQQADNAALKEIIHIPCENISVNSCTLFEVIHDRKYYQNIKYRSYQWSTQPVAGNIVTQDHYSYNHLKGANTKYRFVKTTTKITLSAYLLGNVGTELDEWTIAFRLSDYDASDNNYLVGYETDSYWNIEIKSGSFGYVTNGTHYLWTGGTATQLTAVALANKTSSFVMYCDGTNLHLIYDGVYWGYKTPNFPHIYLNTIAKNANACIYDVRVWESNIGQAEAIKYHLDTMVVAPQHKYSLRYIAASAVIDEIGGVNGTLVGVPERRSITVLSDKSKDVNGLVPYYTQNGHNFVGNTKVKLPENPVVIAAAANITGNDWFDVGDNANAIEVDAMVNETKEQYVNHTDHTDLILVKDGEVISDPEDTAIKVYTHN